MAYILGAMSSCLVSCCFKTCIQSCVVEKNEQRLRDKCKTTLKEVEKRDAIILELINKLKSKQEELNIIKQQSEEFIKKVKLNERTYKEKIVEEMTKFVSLVSSKYEKLLIEKQQELKMTRQDVIKMRKKYDSMHEQWGANMIKELEVLQSQLDSASKSPDEQTEYIIKSMLNNFTEVLERQASQLREIQERERMLRTSEGFYNYTYEEDEDEKPEGILVEVIFDPRALVEKSEHSSFITE